MRLRFSCELVTNIISVSENDLERILYQNFGTKPLRATNKVNLF